MSTRRPLVGAPTKYELVINLKTAQTLGLTARPIWSPETGRRHPTWANTRQKCQLEDRWSGRRPSMSWLSISRPRRPSGLPLARSGHPKPAAATQPGLIPDKNVNSKTVGRGADQV